MFSLVFLLGAGAAGDGARLEGRVDYEGPREGSVVLGAWSGPASGPFARTVVLPGPGPFSVEAPWPSFEGSPTFGAFLDADTDGEWDLDEPFGTCVSGAVATGGGASGIRVTLHDVPSPPGAENETSPAEVEIDLRKPSAATIRVEGAEAGRGLPVAWVQGRSARAAALADLMPMATGAPKSIRVRVAGPPTLLGPTAEEGNGASFAGLHGARMAAALDGPFRIERRTVHGQAIALAVEKGAGLPEEAILLAGEHAAGFLAQASGEPVSFLSVVVLAGSEKVAASHGASILRLEPREAAAPERAVARAVAEAWLRTSVPDAGSDARLVAAADFLGLLAARAAGAISPEAFLAAFESGGETPLALLLDAVLRDALDGEATLARFLAALAPAARRGGGSLAPSDWDQTLDAVAGFDLSTLWRRVLEKPRGPLSDHLLARAGLRFDAEDTGRRILRPHGEASARASALRGALLADGGAGFPPPDASTWVGDFAGDFEGAVLARSAGGKLGRADRRRMLLRPGAGGLEGWVVEVGAGGAPVPGTMCALRFETSGPEVRRIERLPSGDERVATGAREAGLLCLVERDGEGEAVRWERWRLLGDEARFERWSKGSGDPVLEEGRLRRR